MDSPLAPLLRDEAERLAREAYEAHAVARDARRLPVGRTWTDIDDEARDIRIAAHLALLLDLTRPASMDALARIVAGRVGLVCGVTAPSWERGTVTQKGRPDWYYWSLGDDARCFTSHGGPLGCANRDGWRYVPGISDITNPADALTRAALALSGEAP